MKKISTRIILIVILFLAVSESFSQSHSILTRGLPIAIITGTGTNIGIGDDFGVKVPIGFSFSFYGNSYDSLYVNSNGYLAFGYDPNTLGLLLPDSLAENTIAFAWSDLNITVDSTVNYFTSGIAPNRILVINFKDVPHFATETVNNVIVQIQLKESSNTIEIHNVINRSDVELHTLGIQGNISNVLTQPTLNHVAFSGTNALINEMIRFSINQTVIPPPTLSSSASSVCSGTNVTLTATGCAGTVTWNTQIPQTGAIIEISPLTTSSYTATCTVGSNISLSSLPLTISIFEGAITSLNSGNWDNPSTWSCNCLPALCNDITIETSHTVTISMSIVGHLKNVILKGTIALQPTGVMALKK